MRRGLYEEKLVYSSVLVVSRALLIRKYQCYGFVFEVYNMVERCVRKYEL